MANRKKC